jgi:hypothetical protein
MKKLTLLVTLLAWTTPAFAADAAAAAKAGASDPMAGWTPRKITNEKESKKEIEAAVKEMQQVCQKADLDAAAALVDFPVFMVTDNAKGNGVAELWDREKWVKVMEPMFKQPMPDMKPKHKTDIFVISDALASVDDEVTMTMGGKKTTMRNSTLLVRRDGKWLIKSQTEGGWGDMPAMKAEAESQKAPGTAAAAAESKGTQGATR